MSKHYEYDVYIAGSLANTTIPTITSIATSYALAAFSEWYTPGPEADVNWREYELSQGQSYLSALKRPAAQHIYNFDKRYIDASAGMLLVGPAGKSAHLELGYVLGQGKFGVIYLPEEPDRWDVMYNFASLVTHDIEEAFSFIKSAVR